MREAGAARVETSPLARAEGFLRAHGDALALARAASLLGRRDDAALEALLAGRRCDEGGFGEASGTQASTLRGAREMLEILDEAEIRSGPLAEEVAAWLGDAQREDGSWRSGESGDDGVLETGRLAGQLAKLRSGSPRTLARAEAFLDGAFSPDRIESGGWRAVLAFALPATNGLLARADEALQWCGRALEKGWRSSEIGVADALRTLLLCDVHALPCARIEAGTLLLALVADQRADGGFGAGEGPTPERVEATLLALRAMRRFAGRGAAQSGTKG